LGEYGGSAPAGLIEPAKARGSSVFYDVSSSRNKKGGKRPATYVFGVDSLPAVVNAGSQVSSGYASWALLWLYQTASGQHGNSMKTVSPYCLHTVSIGFAYCLVWIMQERIGMRDASTAAWSRGLTLMGKLDPNHLIGILQGKIGDLVFAEGRDGKVTVRHRPVQER
jgi:hypothetical protein